MAREEENKQTTRFFFLTLIHILYYWVRPVWWSNANLNIHAAREVFFVCVKAIEIYPPPGPFPFFITPLPSLQMKREARSRHFSSTFTFDSATGDDKVGLTLRGPLSSTFRSIPLTPFYFTPTDDTECQWKSQISFMSGGMFWSCSFKWKSSSEWLLFNVRNSVSFIKTFGNSKCSFGLLNFK